ncbi:SGNH/GDSL hydrolase family protein [Vannielia sp. SX4]|uniref:SGNH/GDSL hydrolase family protein n=1 Tax=Vannielia sp. SX4 TaxID=3463852 RepID=UPI004059219C
MTGFTLDLTQTPSLRLRRGRSLSLEGLLANLAPEDMPSISIGTAQTLAGTLVDCSADFHGDPHYRYDGCLDVRKTGSGRIAAGLSTLGITYYCNLEFVTDAANDVFEAKVYVPASGYDLGLRVVVDGKLHSLHLERHATTPNAIHYVRVAFPTARARHITLEMETVSSLNGVIVPSGQGLTRPAAPVARPVGVLGDSFFRGAGYSVGGASGLETAGYFIARLLGADRIVNFAVGGTGWVNAGSANAFGGRLPEILGSGVMALICAGSRNDDGESGIQAAVESALAGLSDVPFVAVSGPAQPGFSSVNAEVAAAAASAGRAFVDTLNVIGPELTLPEGVHPNAQGHVALARAIAGGFSIGQAQATVAAAMAAREAVSLTLTGPSGAFVKTGNDVALTAEVSTGQPGSVTFYEAGLPVATEVVAGGLASTVIAGIASGQHGFTASFVPHDRFAATEATGEVSLTAVDDLGFTDSFTRADGPPVETEGAVPKTWQALGSGGAWLLAGNKLANTTVAGGSHYLVAEAGAPDGAFEVTVSGSLVIGGYIALRATNQTNLLRLTVQGGQIELQSIVANAKTVIATGTGGAWADGDTVRVELVGQAVTVLRNGTAVPGLEGVSCAAWTDRTLFGVGVGSAGGNVAFDDVSFSQIV